jgi:hypothetical protein
MILYDRDNVPIIDSNKNELYIFLQTIPDGINCKNKCLINTEQSTIYKDLILSYHYKNIPIIDYSIENVEYLKINNHYHVPFQYIENKNIEKEKDVCIINFHHSSKNREYIKKNTKNINIISGYGEDRDKELFQYKILTNIHFNKEEYKIHEHMRCDRCIYNKMIIITEPSLYTEKLPLYKYMYNL